jgi:hypothetical protein
MFQSNHCINLSLFLFFVNNNTHVCSRSAVNISSAHIIALNPNAAHVKRLVNEVQTWLNVSQVEVHLAVSKIQKHVVLPIATRMAILQGRHSHSEIGSYAAIGCLLSHVAIWRSMDANMTVAIFEEDAFLDQVSGQRFETLLGDIKGLEWELIVLETGHLTVSGEWVRIGAHLGTCAPPPMICEWQGSRGYLLNQRGASVLLQEYQFLHVQTDALFWMLAAIETRRFRMFWTTQSIAHQVLLRQSTVWDRCLKCYVPISPLFIMIWLTLACLGLFNGLRAIRRICFGKLKS